MKQHRLLFVIVMLCGLQSFAQVPARPALPLAGSNPSDGGVVGGAQNIRYNTVPALLTNLSLPENGTFTGKLEFKWQASTTLPAVFRDIPDSNGATFQPGRLTKTTWYRRLARCSDAAGGWESAAVSNTVTVDVMAGTRRYVTRNGAGSMNGTSWANAYKEQQLQDAINETGVSEVWVRMGTYKPVVEVGGTGDRYKTYQLKNSVALYGGFAGTETALSQRNLALNVTILSGDIGVAGNSSDNCYHVFFHPDGTNLDTTARIDGFSVTGGRANGTAGFDCGGGFYNHNSSPTLTRLTISYNSASLCGGGLFNTTYSAPPMSESAIVKNTAQFGGGVYNGWLASPTFTNVTIAGNEAENGGGIGGDYSGPTLNNSIIFENTATANGNQFYVSDGTATLNYSCFPMDENDLWIFNGFYSVANNNIQSDPRFVNPSGNDYRIAGNSPCINAGYNDYSNQAYDLRGQARIQGDTIDMGAYEYTAGVDPPEQQLRRYVTTTGAGLKNGNSWGNAYDGTQLQLAINAAGVAEVWVAAGTYKPTTGTDRTISFSMKNGVAIYGGFACTETLLSQRNWTANPSILSGDIGTVNDSTDNSYNVVRNSSTLALNSSAILDGFTITCGHADQSPGSLNEGGGIYNVHCNPTLNNLTIYKNSTCYYGGGVSNNYSSPVFSNVTITENFASEKGGGVYNSAPSSPVFNNVTISKNRSGEDGGGVYNSWSSPAFNNIKIFENRAVQRGGGIYNSHSSSLFTNVTIVNNTAMTGGGIELTSSSVNMNNSVLWGNSGPYFGDQILANGGSITLNYSCFSYGPNDLRVYNGGTINTTNHNITSNPAFADPGNGDFRIAGNSPCVNAGLNTYNTQPFDIRGQARIQDGTIDMGAYEWTAGTDPDFLGRRYVTTAGAGLKNGNNWNNAYDGTQLQTAIDEGGTTDVWVAAGTYKPTTGTDRSISFSMKNGVAIYGGYAGTETLLMQRNWTANPTILSGDIGAVSDSTDNSYNVVRNIQSLALDSSAILDGFTITCGHADQSPGWMNEGGGIYNLGCDPTLNNLTICKNSTIYWGGGVSNNFSSPVFNNVTITENFAAERGGGVYNWGSSSPVFNNVTISMNRSGEDGGGIYNESNSPVFNNVTIAINRSVELGGGICNASNSSPVFNNVTIANNTARYGGGIEQTVSSVTMNNSVLWGNSATMHGNQLSSNAGTITLNYSCFSNGSNDSYLHSSVINTTNQNITANPAFADPANGDFRIAGNSPCLNAGLNTYNTLPFDLRGQARIQGGTVDMGAYEWTAGIDPAMTSSYSLSCTFIPDGTTTCFDALEILTVGGGTGVTFENGSVVTLVAGQSILFVPGFHAASGSMMNAYITTTGAFCNAIATARPVAILTEETASAQQPLPGQQAFEAGQRSVRVYPNPNNGRFTIELSGIGEGATVAIYSMLGHEIFRSSPVTQPSLKIDLPDVQRGVYLGVVTDQNRRFTTKIVVN